MSQAGVPGSESSRPFPSAAAAAAAAATRGPTSVNQHRAHRRRKEDEEEEMEVDEDMEGREWRPMWKVKNEMRRRQTTYDCFMWL